VGREGPVTRSPNEMAQKEKLGTSLRKLVTIFYYLLFYIPLLNFIMWRNIFLLFLGRCNFSDHVMLYVLLCSSFFPSKTVPSPNYPPSITYCFLVRSDGWVLKISGCSVLEDVGGLRPVWDYIWSVIRGVLFSKAQFGQRIPRIGYLNIYSAPWRDEEKSLT